jgi:hypothetical protein
MTCEFLNLSRPNLTIICDPIYGMIFSINFRSNFHHFSPILGRLYLCQILPTYTLPTSRGSKIDKNCQNWTPQNRFLLYSSVYIFRSERSALRPPKKWHFSTPHWSKSTAYLWGMGFPIGPFLGVENGGRKVGSFCRKLQNFKKFRFGGPGSPRSIFDDFDPPAAYQILSTFGSFFDQFILGHFWSIFNNNFINL